MVKDAVREVGSGLGLDTEPGVVTDSVSADQGNEPVLGADATWLSS